MLPEPALSKGQGDGDLAIEFTNSHRAAAGGGAGARDGASGQLPSYGGQLGTGTSGDG